MDAEISLVLGKMRVKRQALLDKAEKVTMAIASLEEIFGKAFDDEQVAAPDVDSVEDEEATTGDEPRHSPPRQNSNIPGPFVGMTIHDAGIRVLRAFSTPLKTRFIADELTNGGLHSSGMYRAVYNSLSNSNEAVLIHKRWQLRAWEQGNH